MERLTRRERQVYEAITANRDHRRISRRVIAQQLGMTEECLVELLISAKKKLGISPGRKRAGDGKIVVKISPVETSVLLNKSRMTDIDNDQQETPREARARVARDLAAGKRCSQCWLLIPCDHTERSAA